MPYNGSGVFTRLYDFTADRDAGSPSNVISADKVDGELDGFTSGLSNALTKDGQQTSTADQPMGGFKHTGVATAAPSARSQYVPVSGIQDSSSVFADGGGTADAITAAISPAPTALVNGMRFRVRATAANTTTTPTFTPNSGTITAKTIVKRNNKAVAAGDWGGDGQELDLVYASDIDRWVILNPAINFENSSTIFSLQSSNDNVMTVVIQRNAQTGTSYTVLASDRGKHITFSNGSPVAVALPQAAGSFSASYFCYVENIGAGLVTITPTTSTINGAATLVLQTGEAYLITSDNTNYRAIAMGHSTVAETDFVAGSDTLDMFDASTNSRKSVTGQVLFNAVADIATDASPATGDFVLANDVSASNVAVKQTHASVQTLFAASKSDMESASSSSKNVTPATTQNHPGVAKAHVQFVPRGTNGACTINGTAYNISGVSRTAAGQYEVTFVTDFSSTVYTMSYSVVDSSGTLNLMIVMKTPAAGTCAVSSISASGGGASDLGDAINLTFYGDQ